MKLLKSFPNLNSAINEVSECISDFIQYLLGMWLLINAGIKVNPGSQKDPQLWNVQNKLEHCEIEIIWTMSTITT